MSKVIVKDVPGWPRFCNMLIKNIVTTLLAEKFNLKVVEYAHEEKCNKLGINLFSGNSNYKKIYKLNDTNFLEIYSRDKINFNICTGGHFFQTNEISKLIYKKLRGENKKNIIDNNKFKERYQNNKDIFIHIRLGDKKNDNPGLDYYLKVINEIKNYENIYIGSDSPEDNLIKKLIEIKNAKVILYDDIETIQFASTCKYIILSHGTYSYFIGVLGFFSEVFYPDYKRVPLWCGDIFTNMGWKNI